MLVQKLQKMLLSQMSSKLHSFSKRDYDSNENSNNKNMTNSSGLLNT